MREMGCLTCHAMPCIYAPSDLSNTRNHPSQKQQKTAINRRLDVPIQSNLYRLAGQLLSDFLDQNYFYLFDKTVSLC